MKIIGVIISVLILGVVGANLLADEPKLEEKETKTELSDSLVIVCDTILIKKQKREL